MPSNKVKNPEQMTHKKFVPGANPLVQIPRGFVAGTASLAREGEDLARLFAKYISAPGSIAESWGNRESVLPTNKFFRDELPFKDEGVGAAELNTLGSLAGGVGLPSLAKLTAKYAPKIALAAAKNAMTPSSLSKEAGVLRIGSVNIHDVADKLNNLTQGQYDAVVRLLDGADPYKIDDFQSVIKAIERVKPSPVDRTGRGVIDRLLSEGDSRFTPPANSKTMYDAVQDSVPRARSVREMAQDMSGVPLELASAPSYGNTSRAFEQGFTLPGYRVVPHGDASIIHKDAMTPGAHFAPLGREEQLVDILNKYKNEGVEIFTPEFKPRMSLVYTRPGGMVYVDDSAAEHAFALASRLGLTDELRGTPGYGMSKAPSMMSELASQHGVDSLLYENIYEGVGGRYSPLFKNMDNPSVSILKQKNIKEGSNFAEGGSVYSPDRIDEIVTQHRNSEYDPARVDALVAQLKEEMYG